ncbi:unnamed protein product, partial [marine sediment metagenome]
DLTKLLYSFIMHVNMKNDEDLLTPEEFIKEIREEFPPSDNLNRRTLQFYSSPQIGLLPQPIHKRWKASYYLRKWKYNFIAAKIIQNRGYTLKKVKTILNVAPPEKYFQFFKHMDLFTFGYLCTLGQIVYEKEGKREAIQAEVNLVFRALYWDMAKRNIKKDLEDRVDKWKKIKNKNQLQKEIESYYNKFTKYFLNRLKTAFSNKSKFVNAALKVTEEQLKKVPSSWKFHPDTLLDDFNLLQKELDKKDKEK